MAKEFGMERLRYAYHVVSNLHFDITWRLLVSAGLLCITCEWYEAAAGLISAGLVCIIKNRHKF